MWVFLGLISCFFLGFYDISKKVSLKDNAVFPVLFFASATGGLLFVPFILLSHFEVLTANSYFYVPSVSWQTHLLFLTKSLLVGTSWFFAYTALKNLPLTIVTPIRATGPIWTLFGAMIIFQEHYNFWQWAGIVTVLGFFYFFAMAGNREGISFKSNKWIFAIIFATFLGSISTLYDKFLIGNYDRMAVQAWFSIYMAPVFLPFLLFVWYPKRKESKPFRLRLSIPLIGILLSVADFAYFAALNDEDALITILSVLRRASVIISFLAGAVIFKEVNIKRKAIALAGILSGVLMIVLSTY
jgi:bacterial/archaeal transporter family protein